jgi:hypothetical protein
MPIAKVIVGPANADLDVAVDMILTLRMPDRHATFLWVARILEQPFYF